PLGPTAEWNLQNAARRWHRAKHTNWRTRLLPDGTIRWTAPSGHSYDRKPRRTPPPKIAADARLPPLGDDPGPRRIVVDIRGGAVEKWV
ncbi:MAG: HNH endonuclease signature motif containing protein, partial [Mycobacteriales bacterium]